jgi:hypothetical protein
LDCGSPAAAFAVTALLSGSSLIERPMKRSQLLLYQDVGEQSQLAAGLLRSKRQQGCAQSKAFG